MVVEGKRSWEVAVGGICKSQFHLFVVVVVGGGGSCDDGGGSGR